MEIIQSPSPNFYERKGYKPELIVVHCTDGVFPGDLNHLRNPNPGGIGPVSSHYVLSPTGEVHQLVQLDKAAWHSGRVDHPSANLKKGMLGYVNPNLYSVGIEVSMRGTGTMTNVQHKVLLLLLQEIGSKCGIPLDRAHIVGHREIFSLKTCPGTIDVDALVRELVPGVDRAAIVQQIKELADKLL